MKLYVFQVAPNPTKVRLYLSEREVSGARVEVEEISINIPEGEAKTPGFLKKNPQGQLPVLELENEIFIAESLPIIEYFEEYDPQYKMYGNNSEARAISRSLERTVDTGVLIPVGMAVHATRSPIGLPPNAEVAAAGWRSARRRLSRRSIERLKKERLRTKSFQVKGMGQEKFNLLMEQKLLQLFAKD